MSTMIWATILLAINMAALEGFASMIEPSMNLEAQTRVKRVSVWESIVLSEVCRVDAARKNYQKANAAINALRKYDNDYTWLVFLSNVGDGWASKSSTKVWRNICGKSIVVWRVKKEHAGR